MRKNLSLVAFGVLVASCAPQSGRGPISPSNSVCSEKSEDTCLKSLVNAERGGHADATLLDAYVQKRRASHPKGDWVASLVSQVREAKQRQKGARIIVVADPATGSSLASQIDAGSAAGENVVSVSLGTPRWEAGSTDAVLASLARTAGVDHLVVAFPDRVVYALGKDRLAGATWGVVPVVQVPKSADVVAKIAAGLLRERQVDAVLSLVAAKQYAKATQLVRKLAAQLRAVPTNDPTALRARYVVGHAYRFGADMTDSTKSTQGKAPGGKDSDALTRASMASSEGQGAYAAWLRVALVAGKKQQSAWRKQRSVIVKQASSQRVAALDWAFGVKGTGQKICDKAQQDVPPGIYAGDPFLLPSLAEAARRGSVSSATWIRAYEKSVTFVENNHMVWLFLSNLLIERGDLPGMSAAGSPLYRHVSELTAAHLRALRKFQQDEPSAYSPSGQIGIAMIPGVLRDPAVRKTIIELVNANVHHELADAKKPGELLSSTVSLGVAGMMFPEPLKGAYLGSLVRELQRQVPEKTKGQGGWSVASLYVLEAIGGYFVGGHVDMTATTDGVVQALDRNKHVKMPELGALAADLVRYTSLVAQDKLDPRHIDPRSLPAARKLARDKLKESLRRLAQGQKVSDREVEALTSLVDGLIATQVLVNNIESKLGRKSHLAPACVEGSVYQDKGLVKNVKKLALIRDRLVRARGLRGDSPWARHAGLLTVITSDLVDRLVGLIDHKKIAFHIDDAQAKKWVSRGMTDWTDKSIADAAGSLHALIRSIARHDGDMAEAIGAESGEISTIVDAGLDLLKPKDGTQGALAQTLAGLTHSLASGAAAGSLSKDMVTYAEGLHAAGKSDEATVALLIAAAAGRDNDITVRDSLEVAIKQHSPALWALGAEAAVAPSFSGKPVDPSILNRALGALNGASCRQQKTDVLRRALSAMRAAGQGNPGQGAAALDALLDRGERLGFELPRVQYVWNEPVPSRGELNLSVHFTLAQKLINENSFQLGYATTSQQRSGLDVRVPPSRPDDAGRLYVRLAETASLYHFAQGDGAAAAYAAERGLNGLWQGVRLGELAVRPGSHVSTWVGDVDNVLPLVALNALRSKQPLLAGAVLRTLRDAASAGEQAVLPKDSDDWKGGVGIAEVSSIHKDVQLIGRWRTLIAKSKSCDLKQRKSITSRPASCEQLREGIALWDASILSQPPRVDPALVDKCPADVQLLHVLSNVRQVKHGRMAADHATMLARWVRGAWKEGHRFDALTVMRSAKQKEVCIPGLVRLAQEAGAATSVTAPARVDWLSYALMCTGRAPGGHRWQDLEKLAVAAERLVDPGATSRIESAVVRYLIVRGDWKKLNAFVSRPAFQRLLTQGGPSGAVTWMLLKHASDVLADVKPDTTATEDSYDLACVKFGAPGREQDCGLLGQLRNMLDSTKKPADVAPFATHVLKSLVGAAR